jgi:hypothetical protein
MRTGNEKPSKGETTFKASKTKKKQEHMSNEDYQIYLMKKRPTL